MKKIYFGIIIICILIGCNDNKPRVVNKILAGKIVSCEFIKTADFPHGKTLVHTDRGDFLVYFSQPCLIGSSVWVIEDGWEKYLKVEGQKNYWSITPP